MTALAASMPRLRTIWHPQPGHELIETPNITLRVLQGPPQGQLNDGSLINL